MEEQWVAINQWVAQCLYAPLHWWHNAMPIEVAYMPPCPPYMPASPTIQIMPIYTSPPSQILARGPNFSFKYNEIQIQVLIMGMWNRKLITSDNCKCRVFLDVLLLELWCIWCVENAFPSDMESIRGSQAFKVSITMITPLLVQSAECRPTTRNSK